MNMEISVTGHGISIPRINVDHPRSSGIFVRSSPCIWISLTLTPWMNHPQIVRNPPPSLCATMQYALPYCSAGDIYFAGSGPRRKRVHCLIAVLPTILTPQTECSFLRLSVDQQLFNFEYFAYCYKPARLTCILTEMHLYALITSSTRNVWQSNKQNNYGKQLLFFSQLTLPADDVILPTEDGRHFTTKKRWYDFSNSALPLPEYNSLQTRPEVCRPETVDYGERAFSLSSQCLFSIAWAMCSERRGG